VQVPTLEGLVDLRIPPGSNAGRKLRLRGRGFAAERGAAEGRGDLYVVVDIAMPPASEDPAVGAAWEALRDVAAFSPRDSWT
jgi:curved DNA-binding protein